jgi:hypothetical protein
VHGDALARLGCGAGGKKSRKGRPCQSDQRCQGPSSHKTFHRLAISSAPPDAGLNGSALLADAWNAGEQGLGFAGHTERFVAHYLGMPMAPGNGLGVALLQWVRPFNLCKPHLPRERPRDCRIPGLSAGPDDAEGVRRALPYITPFERCEVGLSRRPGTLGGSWTGSYTKGRFSYVS